MSGVITETACSLEVKYILLKIFPVALHFIYSEVIKRKLISVRLVSLGSFSKVKKFKFKQ